MEFIDIENIFGFEKDFKDLEVKEDKFKNFYFKKVKFRSTLQSMYDENNFIYGYIFYPEKNYNGINIIAIHPVHEAYPAFEYACVYYFTKRCYKVSYISLPYHRERTPKGKKCGELFFSNEDEDYFFSMRQSVVDLRHFIYFLKTYENDLNFYGIGLSLGAILLNILMGVDNEIKKGVSIMGGGNILRLTWEGLYGISSRRYYKSKGLNYETYKKELKEYLNYIEKVKKEKKLIKTDKLWYLVDPLTYSSFNNPRNVLFINGIFDFVVVKSSVIELWKNLGKPKLIWIPSSHYFIPVFFPFVLYLSEMFFKS
ncbi:MAG: hypothetical protein QMD25_04715 [Caldisericia bacterium]|jgi:hypothetical protein|nr:hypothetical protein [Caldisericia bacterium]